MEKILITGTGRCGTTFLIKLFTFLNFDTGFTRDNYKRYIFPNCNSGMERKYTSKHYVLKSPDFITDMEQILNDDSLKVKTVIIPIRDLRISALSRVRNKDKEGGLWNATDEESQIEYYRTILTNYEEVRTKYNVNTIFIEFDEMIKDKRYLFDMLKNILDEKNIDFNQFSRVYDEVSVTSKPQPPPPPPPPQPLPAKKKIIKFNKKLTWF
jgi:hypothetical protein